MSGPGSFPYLRILILLFIRNLIIKWQVHTYSKLDLMKIECPVVTDLTLSDAIPQKVELCHFTAAEIREHAEHSEHHIIQSRCLFSLRCKGTQ